MCGILFVLIILSLFINHTRRIDLGDIACCTYSIVDIDLHHHRAVNGIDITYGREAVLALAQHGKGRCEDLADKVGNFFSGRKCPDDDRIELFITEKVSCRMS